MRSPKIWTIFWKISEPLILPLQECNIPFSKLTVRPCQIGVGRLVPAINWSFSGSMLIYHGVTFWDPINLGKQRVPVQFPAFSEGLRPALFPGFPPDPWVIQPGNEARSLGTFQCKAGARSDRGSHQEHNPQDMGFQAIFMGKRWKK